MAPDADRPVRRATLALLTLAYATCEVAAHPDGRPTPTAIAIGLVLVISALVGSYLLPAPQPNRSKPSRAVTFALVAALVLPIALHSLIREWTDEGQPLELQMVNGLRTLGLALAAAAAWPSCRRLAGVVALFLALFAAAMGDQPAIPYLLGALAVVGGIWLILGHKADLAGTAFAFAETTMERVRARFPWRESIVFGSLAVLAGVVVLAGPKEVLGTLGEFVPTSGGTGEQDPFARYGTNDGPEETRGPNANSVGMVESDEFIESQKDSLLDLVSDMYGPPHKPSKNQERMVAGGLAKVKENHGKLTENKRPNRDFDTARQGPKNARPGESRGARAIFEVSGRTPLHIAVVAYDRYDFDKRRWLQAPKPGSRFLDVDPAGNDWMLLMNRRPGGDWYATDDRHELKIADQKDRLVPTPANVFRFRIRKVDKAEYYEWDFDGVLGLAGRTRTPAGVIVHTDCRTIDETRLTESTFASTGFAAEYLEVPHELKPTLARLAEEWAGGMPRGPQQVNAILERLRTEFTLDREFVAPEHHPSPLLWFLDESRRGPDYLFASAAALLLRSLNYPARVCLGYYAAPEAYDPVSGHTPVRTGDLHAWPELLLRDGHWLVVEPTPGYAVLPPRRSWSECALASLSSAANWASRHAALVSLVVVAFTLLIVKRKRVADAAQTLAWKVAPGRTWERVALRTARVLERRGRWAGRSRPHSETLAGWAFTLEANREETLRAFVRLVEWAAYASSQPLPVGLEDGRALCRRVMNEWTLRRFQLSQPGVA